MSRFNAKTIGKTKTVNLAGGEAYKQSPKLELVSILLTSFVQDQYYKDADDVVQTVKDIVYNLPDKEKDFAAKAAIYARDKYGMRSISHVTASAIADCVKGEEWTKNFFEKIVIRPDDMAEILGLHGGKPVPNAMKKGFAKALGKFDAYQLAKYRMDNKEFSLIDIVNLVRPVHTEALDQLMNGTLKPADTWEVKMTQAGQKSGTEEEKEVAKKEVWADLLKTRKLGYFALLRNLRNIAEQAPEVIEDACEMLVDEKLIRSSRVLPFRFMTASKQLKMDGINQAKVFKAINKALDISMANVPVLDGKTLVVVDHSGSMDSVEHGNMSNFEIGALFGVALTKTNDAEFMYFGDDAKYAAIDPDDTTITLVDWLKGLNEGYSYFSNSRSKGTEVGHGTNFHAIFQEANKAYDRIVIFSDMQAWMGWSTPTEDFKDYKRRTGANPKIYSIDLTGHGTAQFPEQDVCALAGFSEKLFETMKLLETDKQALIHEIEKVQL